MSLPSTAEIASLPFHPKISLFGAEILKAKSSGWATKVVIGKGDYLAYFAG
jgi:hypothetical protein